MQSKSNNFLKTTFLETEFKNPLIAGSGFYKFGQDHPKKDIEIWGGWTIKGLTLKPNKGNPKPNWVVLKHGYLNSIGLNNPGWKEFDIKYSPKISNLNTNIIGNLNGFNETEVIALAKLMDQADYLDFIELNVSCPNVKKGGIKFGSTPENAGSLVKKVKKVIHNKKLIVKLSPAFDNITAIAKAVESNGADAISLINTMPAMVIDVETKQPILGNKIGGLSGSSIKPIAIKKIYDVYKCVKIPIIGIGGISSFEDVLECIFAGASLIQIGSALYKDKNIAQKIISKLDKYLKKHKIDNLKDIVGIAHKNI